MKYVLEHSNSPVLDEQKSLLKRSNYEKEEEKSKSLIRVLINWDEKT
jgi:hypothetical protein